jgi:MscS family membrane protein
MSFPLKRVLWLLVCFAAALTSASQLLPAQATKTGSSGTEAAQDPLGRDTPSGTLFGFLQEAQAGNYSTAAQYLQMSAAKRQAQGEDLAAKLKVVIDRAFTGDLRKISDQPDGTPQEGTPLGRQRVGTLSAGDFESDLILVRVTDSGGGRIWLISSETLARVPELYDQAEVHQVESHLPKLLVQHGWLGLPFWQWLATLIALPLATGAGWMLVQLMQFPGRYWRHEGEPAMVNRWTDFSRPLWLVLTTVIHGIFVSYLRIPVLQRHHYQQAAGIVIIIGFSWLTWRILRQLMRRVRERAILTGKMGTGSLMLLGERILKAALVIVAIFAILGTLGFNMTTALAGLGIGGIAIAFAAQKTLENLFGGVSLLGDEVIRVGDTCRFGDRLGTVEDISLRSTRIRTPDRTELSIPNGSLATMNVENLSRRDKIMFLTKLGLRYETSPDQLRYVLAQIRRLLYEHSKVETEGARIRFVGFEDNALNLELFCYILTRDFAEFLAIREDLLLRMMELIEASGTSLALPARTLYVARDSALDKDKTEMVVSEVQKWREANRLPFPDFAPAEIAEFSNSLPYPERGAAAASGK